ncbi:hypothetical protein GCM10023213_28630 [Prosthecobacter algae]|uniref:Uncharacterized protein n=1 Tax=Prosthecobacter algae TaxID=1144682 RepID=A0ABP9PF00_9BACT
MLSDEQHRRRIYTTVSLRGVTEPGAEVAAIDLVIMHACLGHCWDTGSEKPKINLVAGQWQKWAIFFMDFVITIRLSVNVYVVGSHFVFVEGGLFTREEHHSV